MATSEVSFLCTACDKSDARLCSRCRSARYCSTACQQADWHTHKLLCAKFSSSADSSRPSKDHVRAIFFPTDKGKPQIMWLLCTWKHDDDDGTSYQSPDESLLLGPDASINDLPIGRNTVLGRDLSDKIYVRHRDAFLIDGSRRNKSIAAITATKSGQCHDWRGPIIAYGMKGLSIDPIHCRDLDMNDFRHVVDYFLSYGHAA
jgi:hypothetical protein